jgi:hypothetical protein
MIPLMRGRRTGAAGEAGALVLGWLLVSVLTATALAEPTQSAAPARLAIVADPDCANLAALVTAELSSDSGLHLLERDELARIGDETRLRQLAQEDTVSLGKLVGADGLLFLNKADSDAHVRLTAVALGYALYDGRIALGSDPAVAVRSIARLASSYASKLRLDPAKAIPISILNLRAEYATPQSAVLERRLTLLLESRLSAVPEFVVLERRHAGSLGFERSLDPDVRPLLPGSYLVDGSLVLPLAGGSGVTVHLRLKSPAGKVQTLDVPGDTNDLTGLTEKMATAIRQATGHVADPGTWQPQKEAREYLHEGLWARQHGVREAAWEAADSAELLGEQAPDLAALRINLLLDRVGQLNPAPAYYTGSPPPKGLRPPEESTDDLRQAIDEIGRYADGHLENKLLFSNPRQNLDVRTWEMKKVSIQLGTNLIGILDAVGSPRADELRQALRVFTGYAPLDGKPGTHSPDASWLSPTVYTDQWAASLEEALAWLRLSCTVPGGFVEPSLITGQGKDFCPRFLKTPKAQEAAFQKFVAGLRDDPAARLAALVIQTGSPEPAAADAACRAYLDALWPIREALSANQPLRREWTDLGEIPEPVRRRQAAAMIPLLRYYLTHATSFQFGAYCIRPMWLPSEWSAGDAAAIWADYQGCKLRMEQYRQAKGSNVSWLNQQQAALEDPLLKKFPALAAVGNVPGSSLVVTRFWQPRQVPNAQLAHFSIRDAAIADDGLFLLGQFKGEGGLQAELYRIASPGFETEMIAPPAARMNAQRLDVTPEAINVDYYLLGDVPDAERHRIGRFDRISRTWSTSIVTPPSAEYQHVCGETFVHLPDALGRMDPATGQMDLLISDRRKPPRNQLDGGQQARTARVVAGPGNRPCVVSQMGVFYVQSQPGDWTPVFDASLNPTSVTQGGQTMVVSWAGEAVLLDPARSEPEYLMAPAGEHCRNHPIDGQKTSGATTSWQQQTYWDAPGHGPGTVEMNADRVAWQGERFYLLWQPSGKSQSYELLAYTKKGGRTPRRVPLEFRLDAAARAMLAPAKNGDKSSDWGVESIEHPGKSSYPLKPIADRQGLWLYSFGGGVWFIPYADLDEYIRAHVQVVDEAAPSGSVRPDLPGTTVTPVKVITPR